MIEKARNDIDGEGIELLTLILQNHINYCVQPDCTAVNLHEKIITLEEEKNSELRELYENKINTKILTNLKIQLSKQVFVSLEKDWDDFITLLIEECINSANFGNKSDLELLLSYHYYYEIKNYLQSLRYCNRVKKQRSSLIWRFKIFHQM